MFTLIKACLRFAAPGSLVLLLALATAGAAPLSGKEEMAIGAAEAPVTVIEYASMSCSHCAHFHIETLPALKEKYINTGKLRLVFREFPLDRTAFWAAILARCSGEKRFFGFIDLLFRQQKKWSHSRDPLAELSQVGLMGGVGKKDFEACLKNADLGNAILATRLAGEQKHKIQSTPSFVIGGKTQPGAPTLEQFDELLKPLLK
ncbi:MAG TPA: DsbA family protein [Alphaproteobacteria bacterium]|nr:DsbA family protein [Alphaproteobacteria bacterium]MDP6271197.1 DsbA family protein [Alphaproteobacteria bacterium]MDP7429384.1 DsbA family protein [Alphaproteobacteria bacterium]HJM48855.1 DsbA family protein [Alphaproteobacteria bacterium]|tara:strand:+ start:178 stop:789 length:612 start_codon:yes stop_codon:yes gene_type:complete